MGYATRNYGYLTRKDHRSPSLMGYATRNYSSLTRKDRCLSLLVGHATRNYDSLTRKDRRLTTKDCCLPFKDFPSSPGKCSPASLPTYLPITFTPGPHSPKSTSREQSEARSPPSYRQSQLKPPVIMGFRSTEDNGVTLSGNPSTPGSRRRR
jgi:hypothetical protein